MTKTKADLWKEFGKMSYRSNPWPWFRLLYVEGVPGVDGEESVYCIESLKYPGYYMVDPGVLGQPGFELRKSDNPFSPSSSWAWFEVYRAG